MTAQDYPITTAFGWVKGYPLNLDPVNHPGYGYHNGQDRAMPNGTPVVVNGVTIGISNNTGASTGPHLHVGKFVNGVVQNPNGGGFQFNSAVVFDTGSDATNGNFVRITGDGALWNYLHLQSILVTKGQVLKGATVETYNTGDAVNDNNYEYGKDNGQFRGNVGLDWKTAHYNYQEQVKKDKLRLTNSGDVPALNAATGRTDGNLWVGKPWKEVCESYIFPNIPKTSPDAILLKPGTVYKTP